MRKQSLWVRSRRRSIHALVSLALLAGPAGAALADDHPTLARGYDRATAFATGEVDDVNLFNGNLVVTLPVGVSYPAGGSFSYQLNLVYNSRVWDLIGKQDLIGPPVNGWQSRVHAMPTRHSNAGLGWTLGLGRLHAPDELDSAELRDPQKYTYNESGLWLYVGADGGEHKFYPTLHFGDQDEDGEGTGDQRVSYTRDGSYLRMKRLADGRRQVEFPDGAIHTFSGIGVLQSIADRFGNSLTVIGSPTSGEIELEDSQQRSHFIRYNPNGSGIGAGQISQVDLAAFGGQRAVYTFTYARKQILRARHNTYCGTSTGACAVTQALNVDLLDGLELPDGSKYRFLYRDGSETPARIGTGSLSRLVFPTGGFTEWDYTIYTTAEIADPDPIVPDPTTWQAPSRSNSDGISSRVVYPCGGPALGSCPRWTYEQEVVSDRNALDAHKVTRVTSPDRHVVESYFNVWAEDWDYSMPYSRLHHDGTTPRRYLSRKHLQWNETHQRLDHVRSVFVRYESDSDQAFPVSFILGDPRNMNQRKVAERTLYVDDGNKWADTTYANFDGLGNFRSTSLTGNFGSGDQRTTFRQVEPAGRYEFDPEAPGFRAEHNFTRFPEGSPWILGLARFEDVSNGSTTYRVETCHEPATGFPLRRRTLKNGTAKSDRDVLVAYGRDAQGNVVRESYFGGDLASPPSEAAACGVGAGTPGYRVDHTYQHGARRSSETLGAGFKSLDLDLDANTGLAVTSRDATGFATGYEYDRLGRPLWEKPGAGSPVGNGFDAWTEIVYTRAADANPASNVPPCRNDAANQCARINVLRHTNGSRSADSVLTEEELVFDALGRPWRDMARLPAGSGSAWRSIETLYDAMSRAVSVSEPAGVAGRTSSVTTPVTRYELFDSFGRSGRMVPPDGAFHAVTTTFAGDREKSTFSKVWTSEGLPAPSEQTVQTVERRDRLGRLRQVAEDVTTVNGQTSTRITTTYGYDPADRMISVTVAPAGAGSQQRSLFYDGRGFLLWEDHPEMAGGAKTVESATAGRDVQYGDYDALGKPGRVSDGGGDLRHAYDAAGRLLRVSVVEDGVSRPLKEFTYTNQNVAGDWAKGKLRRASRYNYPVLGGAEHTVRIDYVHTYGGRGGRLSDRETQVVWNGSPASERFTQSWRWNDLGNVEHLDYPQCAFAACTGSEGTLFTDVPAGDPARPSIEALAHAGVTTGCGSSLYCPNQSLTRAQAAVFLLASIEGPGYQPPACTSPMFADVPCSNPMAPFVNEFARRGFTSGCGGGNFCPNNGLTREQIAVFLLVGAEGSGYSPPSCSSARFTDVPCGSGFSPWINEANRRGYMAGCTGTQFCPQSLVTRRDMAVHLVAAFELPVVENPSHPRRVRYAYDRGALVGVTGMARLAYHPNGMTKTIERLGAGGAVASTWSQTLDQHMRRPGTITIDAAQDRTLGPYHYDGSGNVRAIGGDAFQYDRLGRLTRATLSGNRWQSYAYDGFGNLVQVGSNLSGFGRSIPTDHQTNRLGGSLTTKYDAAGNLRSWNGQVYTFDPLHRMTAVATGTESWVYLYDADDERVWKFETTPGEPRHDVWTLRDLDRTVLRTYDAVDFASWTIVDDLIHANGKVLAASNPQREATGGGLAAARHYHHDHLGTPRSVTSGSSVVASYDYFPYGEELTPPSGNDPLRFTGHERDLGDPTSHADDLDSMHARFYNPQLGRFLSVDPAEEREGQSTSHGWNRYAYAGGSPLVMVDPDGAHEHHAMKEGAAYLSAGANGLGYLATTAKLAGGAALLKVGAVLGIYAGLAYVDEQVTEKTGCKYCVENIVGGPAVMSLNSAIESLAPIPGFQTRHYASVISDLRTQDNRLNDQEASARFRGMNEEVERIRAERERLQRRREAFERLMKQVERNERENAGSE